ncbi:hypothetical protein Tco_1567705 [Tanacetum coccineum]
MIAKFKLAFEAEALPLAGAERGSFMVTPFKALVLNVEFDFKIDLIIFGPETGSIPFNFSKGGRELLQTKDSSTDSGSVAEESVTATRESVVLICDLAKRILLVSWFVKIDPSASDS